MTAWLCWVSWLTPKATNSDVSGNRWRMDTFVLSLENAHLGCWSAWRKCQIFAQQTVSFDWKPSPCTFQPSLCSLLGNNPCDVADRNVFWLHVYSAKPGFQGDWKGGQCPEVKIKVKDIKRKEDLKSFTFYVKLTHLVFFHSEDPHRGRNPTSLWNSSLNRATAETTGVLAWTIKE